MKQGNKSVQCVHNLLKRGKKFLIFGHDLLKRGNYLVQSVQNLLKQGNKFLIHDQNKYILVHLLCAGYMYILFI